MHGIRVLLKKELADHFSSYRFTIIFALIAMISLITAYMVGINIRQELEGVAKPRFIFLMLFTAPGAIFSLVQFVAFFGPLVGLILGFDTINRERNEGTLSKLLSQPIYRDVVINGKFLAGVVLITIMMVSIVLVITGLGLMVMGIVPGLEEIWRIIFYLIISIVYISFWLGVAILFSILFRSTATSALAALAVWIFFSFFVSIGANILANALTADPSQTNEEAVVQPGKNNKSLSTDLSHGALHGCHGDDHRPHAQIHPFLCLGGSAGKPFHVAFFRPPALESKHPDRHTLHHLSGGHHHHLLCRILHGVHAAGDSVVINDNHQSSA